MQRVDSAIGKLAGHPRHRRIIAPADARVIRIRRITVMTMAKIRDPQAMCWANMAAFAAPSHAPFQIDHVMLSI